VARLDDVSLPQARADEIADLIEQGRIGVCLPFLLEAGYSARSGIDHRALMDELLESGVAASSHATTGSTAPLSQH
jgi:hypothetical protein